MDSIATSKEPHASPTTQLDPLRRRVGAAQHDLHDCGTVRHDLVARPVRRADVWHSHLHDRRGVLRLAQQVTRRFLLRGQPSRQVRCRDLK